MLTTCIMAYCIGRAYRFGFGNAWFLKKVPPDKCGVVCAGGGEPWSFEIYTKALHAPGLTILKTQNFMALEGPFQGGGGQAGDSLLYNMLILKPVLLN